MPKTLDWEQWEHDVQGALGLDATICSGNKWNDIGDATDNTPPSDNSFRLLVDCKFTKHMSYSVVGRAMRRWINTGTEHGKRSILALRFWPYDQNSPDDFVVIGMDDFAELLAKAKEADLVKQVKAAVDPTYLEREEYRRSWF
jgi:hypothetical protein